MDSQIWDDKVDSSIEILNIQQRTISVYMNTIYEKIVDSSQRCDHINSLLDQLELLCQKQFEYDEQLLEQVNFPSVAEQRRLHGLYLKAINLFKAENDQCHSASCIKDFLKLRLDFISTINKETMLLCDFLLKV